VLCFGKAAEHVVANPLPPVSEIDHKAFKVLPCLFFEILDPPNKIGGIGFRGFNFNGYELAATCK
jgi:hypothetical protein